MTRFSHPFDTSSAVSRVFSLTSMAGVLFASSLAFAQAPDAEETRTATNAVVYGDDDRRDVSEHPDASLRALASESVVTLVNRANLRATGSAFSIGGSLLGQAQNLCSDEAFTNQPTAGFCSGTLIGPDLVLTAGHCVTSEASCGATSFVFDYEWRGSSVSSLSSNDVYSCRSIVARQESGVTDYAVLQLDRTVTGRTPATVVDMRGSLPVGTEFAIIGSPSGLPMKIDSGGEVTDVSSGTIFYGTPDSFGGNSGSGIFRASDNALFGVLIAGETDYVSAGSCNRVNICDASCDGEQMIYAGIALDAACANMTSQALCQTSPVCGDGFCGEGERSGCPDDCDAIVCGDGWCGGDEWTTCADDCAADTTCETTGTCADDGFGEAFCAAANTPDQHWAATMTLLFGLFGVLAIRLRPASRLRFASRQDPSA